MKHPIRFTISLIAVAVTALAFSACNTVEGLGEDVTYDAVDHIAQQTAGPPAGLTGSFSFDEFSKRLDEIDLFQGVEPQRERRRDDQACCGSGRIECRGLHVQLHAGEVRQRRHWRRQRHRRETDRGFAVEGEEAGSGQQPDLVVLIPDVVVVWRRLLTVFISGHFGRLAGDAVAQDQGSDPVRAEAFRRGAQRPLRRRDHAVLDVGLAGEPFLGEERGALASAQVDLLPVEIEILSRDFEHLFPEFAAGLLTPPRRDTLPGRPNRS